MNTDQASIQEGRLLVGPLFSEPMRVETVRQSGPGTWILGLGGSRTQQFRRVTLGPEEFNLLRILDSGRSFKGDPQLQKLAVKADALGIAYEFDPYFALSISRVDPLPRQLEAVYDYLLKVPRVRFLLADDAGAEVDEPLHESAFAVCDDEESAAHGGRGRRAGRRRFQAGLGGNKDSAPGTGLERQFEIGDGAHVMERRSDANS